MDVVDPNLDPVEDFLVNRKEGHCEYFASALALLLRSIDIPARMVNGFKGGDWNDLAEVMNVRQKHAHSWVEAYRRRPTARDAPIWMTLDPTPADREHRSPRSAGSAANFRRSPTSSATSGSYIVGFDADRQNAALRADPPARQRGPAGVLDHGRNSPRCRAVVPQLPRRGAASLVRVAVLFVVLAALAWLGWWLRRVVRWLLHRLWPRRPKDLDPWEASVQFYRRLVRLLTPLGLDPDPSDTPMEYAQHTGQFLADRGLSADGLVEVPVGITEAFYRVRFGREELSEEQLRASNRGSTRSKRGCGCPSLARRADLVMPPVRNVLFVANALGKSGGAVRWLSVLDRLGALGVEGQVLCASAPEPIRRLPGVVVVKGLEHRFWHPWIARGPDLLALKAPSRRPPRRRHVHGLAGDRPGGSGPDPTVQHVEDFLLPGARLPLSKTWGRRISVADECLATELVEDLGIPPERIDVVVPGVTAPSQAASVARRLDSRSLAPRARSRRARGSRRSWARRDGS